MPIHEHHQGQSFLSHITENIPHHAKARDRKAAVAQPRAQEGDTSVSAGTAPAGSDLGRASALT